MKLLLTIILSYLIGSFSSAYYIGKIARDLDIRSHGSGNSGTTNAMRVMGKKLGALTFIFDFGKGILAVFIGGLLMGDRGALIAGLGAVVGHNWPLLMGFKGGKGVATSLGVLLILHWPSTIIAVSIGLAIALTTRYVSLGSMSFLTSYPIIYGLITNSFKREYLILAIFLALLAIFRHRSNIGRLLAGNENKLGRW